MAVNMSYSSQPDLEPYSHFTYQASSQLDFTFYSPPHEGGSRDDPVPAAIFNTDLPGNTPSLGLTGDTNMDDLLNLEGDVTPRKRDRGERIVWTPEEDEYLRAAVQLYGDKTEKWAKIAACVPGRTNKNCRKRWFHSLDPKLKKGPWTEDEDRLLMTGVQMFRGQWSRIAERIPGRTDDQCAKRWREGLDPRIDRAAWTPDDDLVLSQRFEEFGSQWQKIALAFPGRPGLHCRNRWRKIQRSLNHMKRTGKRRSLGNSGDQAIVLETRRLEAILDSGNDDLDGDFVHTTDDISLMQDAYLDEDFALENGLVVDENGLNGADDVRDEQSDSEDEKPYGCAVPDCFFVTSSPSLLYYHFKATHAGVVIEKPFKCTFPGCETRKRYKNINGLQYHVTHAKNTQGHSGNSVNICTGDDILESSKSARATQKSVSTGLNTSCSKASSPTREINLLMHSTTYNPSNMTFSSPPTPAELQLQMHQSSRDQASQLTIPQLTRSAFSLPHSPSSLEASATSSRTSSGSSSPQVHRTVYRCPELGCDQTYYQVNGLNMHMANSHGHGSMNMRNNDAVYGSDVMMAPRENHIGFDIDMTDLTSGTASPLDANILLLHESILQHHIENVGRIGINTSPTPATPQDVNFDGSNNKVAFDALSGEGYLFANQTPGSLHNSMHLGNNIGVITHDPKYLQQPPMAIALNSVTGSINPVNPGSTSSAPSTPPTAPIKLSKNQTSRQTTKRFACSAPNCQKSYASMGKLNNHIRNDHPDQSNIHSSRDPDQLQDGDEPMIERPYKCLVPGCGKDYTNINGLKDHLLDAHGSTPRSNN
ncbi:hypothetical protein BGZ76_005066 [Entomortierella beljakovae]|nr:hypothetical protein BGZ76_005066 [Entomortierella beljakovae]